MVKSVEDRIKDGEYLEEYQEEPHIVNADLAAIANKIEEKSKDMGCRNQGSSPLFTRHGRQNQGSSPCFMILWFIIAIQLGSFGQRNPFRPVSH